MKVKKILRLNKHNFKLNKDYFVIFAYYLWL